MIEIHFQHKEDARRLYFYLEEQLVEFEQSNEYILCLEDSYIIQYSNKHYCKDELISWIKEALCQFIMNIKLNDWLRHILITYYYYRDEDEQQQIIDIVHSI